MLLPLPLLPLL